MDGTLRNENKYYTIYNCDNNSFPVVVSLPHSGTFIPPVMKEKLNDNIVLPNMDWYLSDLYSFLPEMGFTVIINDVSRYVIDLNRKCGNNLTGAYENHPFYKHTTMGYEMYKEEISDAEIKNRIHVIYEPYHERLRDLLSQKKRCFSSAILLDLHSFGCNLDCDLVLGNRFGKTASGNFFGIIKRILKKENFIIQDNTPFPGGFIVQEHGGRLNSCEALQIELNYKTYINTRNFGNEEFPQINYEIFDNTKNKMQSFFKNLQRLYY